MQRNPSLEAAYCNRKQSKYDTLSKRWELKSGPQRYQGSSPWALYSQETLNIYLRRHTEVIYVEDSNNSPQARPCLHHNSSVLYPQYCHGVYKEHLYN